MLGENMGKGDSRLGDDRSNRGISLGSILTVRFPACCSSFALVGLTFVRTKSSRCRRRTGGLGYSGKLILTIILMMDLRAPAQLRPFLETCGF